MDTTHPHTHTHTACGLGRTKIKFVFILYAGRVNYIGKSTVCHFGITEKLRIRNFDSTDPDLHFVYLLIADANDNGTLRLVDGALGHLVCATQMMMELGLNNAALMQNTDHDVGMWKGRR